jgi:polyphosphate glucokinase
MATREVLGVAVGGSGIKAAPVNVDDGTLLAPRQRIGAGSRSPL